MTRDANRALPVIILLLYASATCLGASFRQYLLPSKAEVDIIQRIFGELRVFVGDWAFMKAEEYHHRGLPFEKALIYHQGESMFDERNERGALHAEHAESGNAFGENLSLYSKIYSQVNVTEDSHLKPAEEKEVLPWFYVEVAFNPHDIRGYVLGGYWLERVGRKDESLKFLQDGLKHNPRSAQILGAIGELYSRQNNYDEALIYLERSRRLWLEAGGHTVETNTYADSDRFFAFDLLASLYAKKGNYDRALKVYRELLEFGPNLAILEKVKKLERERK